MTDPKVGEIYICTDTTKKVFNDIYYKVHKTEAELGKETTVTIEGIFQTKEKIKYPLLFFNQKFVKVSESTFKILFGKGVTNGYPGKKNS